MSVSTPYTLYVSGLREVDVFKPVASSQAALSVLDSSGFDGMTVMVWISDYEAPFATESLAWLDELSTTKHLWPYLTLTTLIKPGICIDFDDTYKRRSSTLSAWESGINKAKELGSPGIVVDFEQYLDWHFAYMDRTMALMAMPREELIDKLKDLGRSFADLAQAIYPGCTIFCLRARLTTNDTNYTDSFIAQGLIERCQEIDPKMVITTGGNEELPFLPSSVKAFKEEADKFIAEYSPIQQRYSNLILSPSIVYWVDYGMTTDWVKQKLDSGSVMNGMPDHYLCTAYIYDRLDFLWVYNNPATGYYPLGNDSAVTSRMFNLLSQRQSIGHNLKSYDQTLAKSSFDHIAHNSLL